MRRPIAMTATTRRSCSVRSHDPVPYRRATSVAGVSNSGENVDQDRLTDLHAIEQLKSRYFRFLDTKAWDLWRQLFTDDLEFYMEESVPPRQTSTRVSGGDEFVSRVSRALATAVTVHHGHMPDIEFTGADQATGVWSMYDWVDDADKGYAVQGWGYYHERYQRDGGIWRISELRLTRLRSDQIEPTRPAGDRHWPPPWEPSAEQSSN
jgi:hypothetical protein